MKKLFSFAFLIFNFCSFSIAQTTFQKVLNAPGNQRAVAVIQSSSGDFYLLIEVDTMPFGIKDILLTKLNVNGDLLWSKTYNSPTNDYATDVKEISNGKIMLCGYTDNTPNGDFDVYLINLDTAGNVIWSKTYGGTFDDYGFKMAATPDSAVAVAGKTSSFGTTATSGYLLKVGYNGTITWSLTSSSSTVPFTWFNSIDNTFDGDFILAGSYQSSGPGAGTYIAKVSGSGTVLAHMKVTGLTIFDALDVKSIPGGDFLFAGLERTPVSDSGSVLLFRGTPVNPLSFCRNYVSTDYEAGKVALITPDGYLAVAGSAFYGNNYKGILVKTELTGNLMFGKSYGVSSTDCKFNSAIITNDNSFLMVGEIKGYIDSLSDIYLVKAQLNGTSGCNESANSLPSNTLLHNIGLSNSNNWGGLANTVSISSTNVYLTEITLCSTEVEELNIGEKLSELSVYPVPARDVINVKSGIKEGEIFIIDCLGRVAFSKNFLGNFSLPVKELPAGVYSIRLIEENTGSSVRGRFLKE